jgi:hypothetical protein
MSKITVKILERSQICDYMKKNRRGKNKALMTTLYD